MKTIFLIFSATLLLATTALFSQDTINFQMPTSINLDGSPPDGSAVLDVQSTTKGMLVPRMTTAQREAIATPAAGLLVFDTDTGGYWYFNDIFWLELAVAMPPTETEENTTALPIPDCDPAGVVSIISLSQAGTIVADMQIEVCLDITHTRTKDVDVSLESPGGTVIDLVTEENGGGTGGDFTNTCFSTNASNSISSGTAPYTGYWIPQGDFSDFIGGAIAGEWKLKVVDDKCSHTGQFNSWSIKVSGGAASPIALSDEDKDTKIQVESTPDEDFIRFDVSGSQAMLIDTLGRVGIGSTAPTEKLEVDGAIKIDDTTNPSPAAGTIRWNPVTGDFEGFTGSEWKSLTNKKFGRSLCVQNSQLAASDGAEDDLFGGSVSISGDYAVVGASGDDDNGSTSGSAYVFHRTGTAWLEQAKLTASDGAANDFFGGSVSISGDYAIAGASGDDDNGAGSGSAYVFYRTGTVWAEQAKLTASDGAAGDDFGTSVSISGDYVIVGAYSDEDNGVGSGSAYVFHRTGTVWSEQSKLTASDGAAGDFFGFNVSISGDYAIVGASGDDDNGSSSGSAYVFYRTGTVWSEQAKLTASDGAAGDDFGTSVSISGDYVIVGAYSDEDNGADSGSAYVFHRTGTVWAEQAKLTASDGAASDFFGRSVSISGDYAIVGALFDDDNGGGSGSAYVFHRTGTVWSEQAKLTASDGAGGDFFGASVSISGDYAIAGAEEHDTNGNSDQGQAYIFKNE